MAVKEYYIVLQSKDSSGNDIIYYPVTKLDAIEDLEEATALAAGLMSAADKVKLDGLKAGAAPTPAGAVMINAGKTIPAGFLLCNGAAISRTTYTDLYAAIGTTYGSGNGSSTFNIPNITKKALSIRNYLTDESNNYLTDESGARLYFTNEEESTGTEYIIKY